MAAEVAISFLLENLSGFVSEKVNRTYLGQRIQSLERELPLMKHLFDSAQSMAKFDQIVAQWLKETQRVLQRIEDLISLYEQGMARKIFKFSYLKERRELGSELERVTRCLHDCLLKGIKILNDRNLNLPFSSDRQAEGNISDFEFLRLHEPAAAVASRLESFITIPTVNQDDTPYLMRCLSYVLLFPTGNEIPVRRLIAVWIAEGVVGPRGGEKTPAEHLCHFLLDQLIAGRKIKATRWKRNGKIGAIKLCDDMRVELSKMANAAHFFVDPSNNVFRLALSADRNDSYYEHIDGSKPWSSSQYKNVVSFFSFDTTEGRKHGENIGNFLHRCIANGCFKAMRVLDLERVFKPKLPSALGALTGLRYLGLRWTYLERLPDHVSMLLNLQVLDVKRTYISNLPESIWNMQYLRHLYLSETYRSRFVSPPRNIKPLDDLLTLWGAFVDEDSPVVNGLDTILHVRKLGLTCRSMSPSPEKMKSQLEAVGDWIINLGHLEDLRIKSFDDLNKPSDLYLKPFSGHRYLSTVYLVGRLRYPTIVSEFPVTITDITLSRSELDNDPMVALQNLPNLQILRLLAASTKSRKMKCNKGVFPKLEVLKLWSLENWDEWKLKKGALACLTDLEIRNCHKMKMIPQEITHLRFLSKFRLSYQFAEEIKKNQSSLWNEIKHVFIHDEE